MDNPVRSQPVRSSVVRQGGARGAARAASAKAHAAYTRSIMDTEDPPPPDATDVDRRTREIRGPAQPVGTDGAAGPPGLGVTVNERPGARAAVGPDLESDLVKARLMANLFGEVQELPRIDRFVLLKREGAGAMGAVYVGYDEELERKVAIKLVRPDRLASSDGEAATDSQRLLREARMLASMPHHRNLVQVYEAGIFGERVFLAMEYIRGQTLRAWLDAQREVPPRQRWRKALAMFLEAGRGLEAAHGAGVVHRDFKPDNVLVGLDGRVCVVDFGVARPAPSELDESSAVAADASQDTGAVEAALAESQSTATVQARPPLASLTRTGTAVGTPAYMSPEQLRAMAVDKRSDQFSFCVALYEALYGVRPFQATDVQALRELVLAGRYSAPPREAPVPPWIWKVLERGLAVEPGDRYESMSELLAALARDPVQRRRRYLTAGLLLGAGVLAGHAVFQATAGAPDPCELAGSAVEDIWSPTIATRAGEAFLGTGIAYAGSTWERIRPELDRYAGALAAERKSTCEATRVRHEQSEDLFTRRMLCLDRRERHLAALASELARADASTVEHAARSVSSLPRIEACRDSELLMAGVAPPDDPEVAARARDIQQRIAQARVHLALGHQQEARSLAEAALADSESVEYPPLRAEALSQVGAIWRHGATAGDVAAAETALLEAVDLAESQRSDELVNETWLELVSLADYHHDDHTRAHEWARRALATSDRMQDDEARVKARLLLGGLYHRAGDYQQAERLLQEALARAQTRGVSKRVLASVWNRLGAVRKARSRFDEARVAYEQALALSRAELGAGHPRIADLAYNAGMLLRDLGELDRARELFHEALAIWTEVHGPESTDGADAYLELALIEIEAGDLEKAGEYARIGGAILAAVAPDRPERASAEIRLGLVAFRQGRFADALDAFERGLAIRQRTGAPPAQVALAASNVGEALIELGRFDEALLRLDEAERALASVPDALPAIEAAYDKVRGLALLGKGDAGAALRHLERALSVLESQPGISLEEADTQWAVARALRVSGAALDVRGCGLAEAARERYRALGKAGARANEDITRWLAYTVCTRRPRAWNDATPAGGAGAASPSQKR
jgi:tetratricopeptide (TPR) repeat protein/tRNA A-37 threonylcarbamoyl transferase component Bud32